jgi:UDP-N-acetylglucosamine 2-epimerase (non-hydrolysing)
LIMTGLRAADVIEAVKVVTTQFNEAPSQMRTISDYNVDNVSQKVVRIILSYTNYVNHAVWSKGFSE